MIVKVNPHFYPVILAGGRGTRFWPLSRKRRAKQVLALDGKGLPLKLAQPPATTRGPYRPVASWGQTAYFEVDLDTLKRMASSRDIELVFKAAGTPVRFAAAPDASEAK